MRPFARRTAGTLVAMLALGMPALTAGAVPGTSHGVPGATGTSSDARSASSCDRDGVATSFVLGHDGPAVVEAITVSGVSPDCAGHRIAVVVGGIPGEAVAVAPRTTVLLAGRVPASHVTTLTVSMTPIG